MARLPAEVETALYRIAQEALTKVLKHAAAKAVSLVVRRELGGSIQIFNVGAEHSVAAFVGLSRKSGMWLSAKTIKLSRLVDPKNKKTAAIPRQSP